jgi:hypothetical protein
VPGSGTDRRQTRLEGGPAIILVEPQLAENIGMCARAMANFGLSDLRLVAPRDGWPKKGARSAASGAAYILDEAKLFVTLEEAIGDLNLVYATTARDRHQLKPVLTPSVAESTQSSGSVEASAISARRRVHAWRHACHHPASASKESCLGPPWPKRPEVPSTSVSGVG